MELFPSLIYAFLPLSGLIIGAILQHWLSRRSEERKNQQGLRTQAYVDFLRGVSGVTIAQQMSNSNKEEEFTVVLTDAKARITIYGSKQVIERIANFWRSGARTDNQDGMTLFVDVCQMMRKESLPKGQRVLDKEVSQLLFGTDQT